MKDFFKKYHRIIFYGSWLTFGLIQSRFTELQDDEAYYWVYSRYLDWGYFDHPPMIAVLVKWGYGIFHNELGVRLFPLLLSTLSLFIIEKLTVNKNWFLFYAIALSVSVSQLGGFMAVPDIPLIFFSALFFLCYKRFIGCLSWQNTVLLGFCIALLFYSKYQAVLVVLFTLLSNIKLLTRHQTWLAVTIALFLFSPHLWWQYQHGWVSFHYHLFENHVTVYKFSFTINYILGQLLLPGPFAGFILLPAAFLFSPKDKLEKALKYTMAGIYVFFLLGSLRGNVEANWTTPVLIPLIVLSHQYLTKRTDPIAIGWKKILCRLLPVTILLVMLARAAMLFDFLPMKEIKLRYHAWKNWPAQMKEKTKGLPVVFSNSYQRASKYWFYSGQITYSQNYYRERRNNYNFWPVEDSLLGKPVYFLDIYTLGQFSDSLKTPLMWIGYKYDPSFISFAKVQIDINKNKFVLPSGKDFVVSCAAQIPALYEKFIRSASSLKDTVIVGFFDRWGWRKDIVTGLSLRKLVDQKNFELTINPGLPKGRYSFLFAIKSGNYNLTHNSRKVPLVIK